MVSDSLLNTDILNHKIFFKPKVEEGKARKKEQLLKMSVEPKPKNSTLLKEGYIFRFDYPVVLIDTSKIEVKDDTISVLKYDYELVNKMELRIKPKAMPISKFVIKIEKGAFVDMNNDTNSVIEFDNPILKINETGLLAGRVGDEETEEAFIFQLIEAESKKLIKELSEGKSTFLFEHIVPNSYVIRAIKDKNKNGIWDTGNFSNNQQPEEVLLIKEPIKIKANFEFRDIIIPLK